MAASFQRSKSRSRIGGFRPLLECLEKRLLLAGDAFEPDNTWTQASVINVRSLTNPVAPQQHSIDVISDIDWAKFTLASTSNVLLDTRGSTGDTALWLYRRNSSTNQLDQLDFSNDEGNGRFSQLLRAGNLSLPAGEYYLQALSNGQSSTIASYTIGVTAIPNLLAAAYRDDNPYWTAHYAPASVDPKTLLGQSLGNCTWFAVGRAKELGATSAQIAAFAVRSAEYFDDQAQTSAGVAAGLKISASPAIGAIAQWNPGTSYLRGHVAVVERVNKDASGNVVSIDVSESSFIDTPASGNKWDVLYQTRNIPRSGFGNFILFSTSSGNTGTAPTTPGSFTAAAVSTNQVRLSWIDSSHETEYRIYQWNGMSATLINVIGVNSTSYNVFGLAANTTYYFYVEAANGIGKAATGWVSVTTPPLTTIAPAAPSNLTAYAVSPSQITVSWQDNSGNEQEFRVYRWTGAWTLVGTVTANTRSFTVANLPASTTQHFTVTAFNGGGERWASTYVTATTPAAVTQPSTAPTNVIWRATSSNVGYLTWNDNSNNESGFLVQFWTGSAWATLQTVSANVTTSSAYSLQRGYYYYFRIVSYNATGQAASSSVTVYM